MADGHRECVGGGAAAASRRPEHGLHHALHLSLLGAAVAADGLLHRCGRILGARHAGGRAGDERGAARLPDGERDTGVGADVGLLERHRLRLVPGDEVRHLVVDLAEPRSRGVPRRGLPPAVLHRSEAAAVAGLPRCRNRTLQCPGRCRGPSRIEVRRRPGRSCRRRAATRMFAFTPGLSAHHSRRWPKTLARCSASLSGRSGVQDADFDDLVRARLTGAPLQLKVGAQGAHVRGVADLDLHVARQASAVSR